MPPPPPPRYVICKFGCSALGARCPRYTTLILQAYRPTRRKQLHAVNRNNISMTAHAPANSCSYTSTSFYNCYLCTSSYSFSSQCSICWRLGVGKGVNPFWCLSTPKFVLTPPPEIIVKISQKYTAGPLWFCHKSSTDSSCTSTYSCYFCTSTYSCSSWISTYP